VDECAFLSCYISKRCPRCAPCRYRPLVLCSSLFAMCIHMTDHPTRRVEHYCTWCTCIGIECAHAKLRRQTPCRPGAQRLPAAPAVSLTFTLSQRRLQSRNTSPWGFAARSASPITLCWRAGQSCKPRHLHTHLSSRVHIGSMAIVHCDAAQSIHLHTCQAHLAYREPHNRACNSHVHMLSRRPKPHHQHGRKVSGAGRQPRARHPASSSCGSAS